MRKTVSPRRQPEPVKVTSVPRCAVVGVTRKVARAAAAGTASAPTAMAIESTPQEARPIADRIRPVLAASLDNRMARGATHEGTVRPTQARCGACQLRPERGFE